MANTNDKNFYDSQNNILPRPMNNFDIERIMSAYVKSLKCNDFIFIGAVPIDFADLNLPINDTKYDDLYEKGINKFGIVFNLDEHYKPGSRIYDTFYKF